MKGVCRDCRGWKEIIAKDRCWRCYQRERRKTYTPPQEQCSICKEVKPVNFRTNEGKAVCTACYQREFHLEQCSICKEVKPVNRRTDEGKAVCNACSQRQRKRAKMASPRTRVKLGSGRSPA